MSCTPSPPSLESTDEKEKGKTSGAEWALDVRKITTALPPCPHWEMQGDLFYPSWQEAILLSYARTSQMDPDYTVH